MASNQAIEYAHQCGDLTVESFVFQTNNVVGNFNYPPTIPAYKPICKFLMNCPLKTAFTKCPSVFYKNFLMEFWCTVIAYDPNPPVDETKSLPLKEYLIRFLVMNVKKPLTLDFKTFTTSTGLDYNNGAYIAHPSPEVVKAELAKIVTNPSYLDKNPCLEELFSRSLENSSHICDSEELLGLEYTQDEKFRKKGKSQTMTLTLPKSQGFEASVSLSKKRNNLSPKRHPMRPSKDEEVFVAGEDMDEDTQADEEVKSPPPNTHKPVEQTNKVIDAAMNFLDKNSITRGDILNALNGVTDPLKTIQDVVKDYHVLNKKILEATEAYIKKSTNLTKLITLIKNFDFQGLKSLVESIQATALRQEENLDSWAKSEIPSLRKDTSDIKSIMTEIYQAFKVVIEEHPSPTEGETKDMETQDTDKDKVVREEAEKMRLDPKTIISAKAGEKFKKAQDVKHRVLKREHSQKAKRAMKLRKKRFTSTFGPHQADSDQNQLLMSKFTPTQNLQYSLCTETMTKGILRSLHEGVPFMNNMVIEEPEYAIFFTDVFCDQAFQRWNDIHKVGVDSLVSYLVMASMVKTLENARFGLKLRDLIAPP
uniref:Copia protein n=1 Tax=Tanacetum cinerariifolium TaxID=118510 RepID=A0A6L2NBP9_TANCI|nr:copia protein [Tanacetum cinerariifolium]